MRDVIPGLTLRSQRPTMRAFSGGPMANTTVSTPQAPQAIGPYSQAIVAGQMVFTSGQIPLDPATQQMVQGDIRAQAERVMENLSAVLAAAGATFAQVVKATIFLVDLGDFAAVNEVYGKRFPHNPPARSTVQVAALPKGARVEIELIAIK
jgi:2-iminobutanoate/2-iminopropanoate deaminase